MSRKRILVFGISPLPEENPDRLTCPEIRTSIIVNYLKKNYKICLISIRGPCSYYKESPPDMYYTDKFGFEHYSLHKKLFSETKYIKELSFNFKPDLLIGINIFTSYHAAITGLQIPFWADLNGSMIMQGQLKSFIENEPNLIRRFLEIEKTIIQRADKFSVVSRSQKFELVGELGIFGRLIKFTSGYEFIEIVPEPIMNLENIGDNCSKNKRFFEEEDFVVLWIGGYSDRRDIEFLFKVLEGSMKENPKIKFLSIGGDIEGHTTKKFKELKELVKDSPFKENFKLIGWVKTEDVSNYCSSCDFGINIDRNSYETLMGARYRIVEMMRNKLPVITTLGSEITTLIKDKNLGYTSRINDTNGFINNLVSASRLSRAELDELKSKVFNYSRTELSPEKLFKPLIDWIQIQKRSPDHNYIVEYSYWSALLKKVFTLLKLLQKPRGFFRVFKKKLEAFLNG